MTLSCPDRTTGPRRITGMGLSRTADLAPCTTMPREYPAATANLEVSLPSLDVCLYYYYDYLCIQVYSDASVKMSENRLHLMWM